MTVTVRPAKVPTLRERASGVLLHVTSLPGPHGSGDLGPQAYGFVDLLAHAGVRWWQVLPLNPPGGGASPYQATSVFAGNPLLVALEPLIERGWLRAHEVAEALPPDASDGRRVDFARVARFRDALLRHAHARMLAEGNEGDAADLQAFSAREQSWLEDYLIFTAQKRAQGDAPWFDFPEPLRRRDPDALATARSRHSGEIAFQRFVQWQFDVQWRRLRAHAHARGVGLLGDVPIFVADDSADVWAHQDLFFLGPDGRPTVVAGVPPDYFSALGQRWGNALYRWDAMAAGGYRWWIDRLRVAFSRHDAVRLDHFIGFHRYWEIPAAEPDARGGRFRSGPGRAFFDAVREALGDVQLVAEDLGVLTPEVEALRDELGLPGMRVLQFSFGVDPGARAHHPHAFPRRCVVYTGTHDNDTILGWLRDPRAAAQTPEGARLRREREYALRYVASDGREPHWDMIRCALSSHADLAVLPMQDVLGLDGSARMNVPGTTEGNWTWRMRVQDVSHAVVERLRGLLETYDRTWVEAG
jgi:4-alpha-glucanotransferase